MPSATCAAYGSYSGGRRAERSSRARHLVATQLQPILVPNGYTPPWLNMVEIEIGVLRSQCLDRRIEDRHTLKTESAA
jgi:hypothetical protein